MNVEIGAEAALFPEKEYINGIAVAVCAEDLSVDPALRALITEVLRDCDLRVSAYLGKTSIMGSILSSASISDQVAAARPKLEKAPPRKTSVRLICSTKITINMLIEF
jgi:hypothetical protein